MFLPVSRIQHPESGLYCFFNLARAQAAGADIGALGGAVDLDARTLKIRMAHLAGAVVGVGHVATHQNTLIADITFT